MSSAPLFIGLKTSPYTWRALWALQHHGVNFNYREYLVFIDEPYLKWQARRWNTTVPLLITPEKLRLMDSIEIARYADRNGKGQPLFPKSLETQMPMIIALCNSLLSADRALFCIRVLRQSEMLDHYIPWKLPRFLLPIGRALTAFGIRYIGKSFQINRSNESAYMSQLHQCLEEVESFLNQNSDADGIMGEFSFADLSIAAALKMMRVELFPEIHERFVDVLTWGKSVEERFEQSEVTQG